VYETVSPTFLMCLMVALVARADCDRDIVAGNEGIFGLGKERSCQQ